MRWSQLLSLGLVLTACTNVGKDEDDDDGPPGPRDRDSGAPGGTDDGGGGTDGGATDGGGGDGGSSDGGGGDGGSGDGGSSDGGSSDGGSSDGGTDSGDAGDPLECGHNARPDGDGACECEPRYEFCAGSRTDCCAYDATSFEIIIWEMAIVPYTDAGYPWDWDGDVPDYLLDALDLVAYFYPEAATWAEVLGYVDEYAPLVLEGTVPPDPYMDAELGEEWLGATSTFDDTYTPMFAASITVDMSRFDVLFNVFDEDLVFDDDVQSFWIDLDGAQAFAGWGEQEFRDIGNLFSLTIEIRPVW